MKAKISYTGLQRIVQYFVAEDAMREAILNAVIHKQYESGIPIQVSVYKDKLYIGNIGRLPADWTVENLYRKHNSKPYNPDIAHVFYLAGHIESWGRGVEKMFESCKTNNLPAPIYHVNSTDILIEFNAPKGFIIDNFAEVTEGVTERVTERVTEKELEVLQLLLEDPGYTSNALAEKLNVSRKTIANRIRSLKQKNVITRIGSDTKGHWRINKF